MQSAPAESAQTPHVPSAGDHRLTHRQRKLGHERGLGAASVGGVTGSSPARVSRPQSAARHYFAAKRCVDIVGACVLLVLASPLLAAIPIAIKLDSRGPVLFRRSTSGTSRPTSPVTTAPLRNCDPGAGSATPTVRCATRGSPASGHG